MSDINTEDNEMKKINNSSPSNIKRKSDRYLNNDENINQNSLPIKKKGKIRIKKEEELIPAYICNANEAIIFKIIHTKEEFYEFQSMTNMEYSFNSSFSNQLFVNDELITGYKNLKILISLTPMMFSSHIKINYEKCLKVKDDLELLLKAQFENAYETNDQIFLEKLESEKYAKPKGKLIYSGVDNKLEKNLQIYLVDILKDEALALNWNYQCLCTFFIDGASFIPIENNFWNYYILYEKRENGSLNTIGFSSCLKFNLNLYSHRSMVSQFISLPPYQRRGFGNFLLEKIYNYLAEIDKECIEITTEDPSEEFILLRDITIFNKILNLGYFDEFLRNFPAKNLEEFNKIRFSESIINELFKKLKVAKNLIKRSLLILKYILIGDNKQLYSQYKNDCQSLIYKWNRADYEYDYFIKRNEKGGPYISFHDETEFSIETSLTELQYLNNNEQTSKINYLIN